MKLCKCDKCWIRFKLEDGYLEWFEESGEAFLTHNNDKCMPKTVGRGMHANSFDGNDGLTQL